MVFITTGANHDDYLFFDVSVHFSIGVIGEDHVEVFYLAVEALLKYSLAHRAGVNRIDFEFQAIAVPLHMSMEDFGGAGEVVDIPGTDDTARRPRATSLL